MISGKKSYNTNIEALRGFAALMVVLHHLCQYRLDEKINLENIIHFTIPGHVFVMIFFMLSGYVIGVSYKPSTNSFNILEYLKKRVIRIYPIYFLVVLFSFVIADDSCFTLFGGLFFLQNAVTANFISNSALWSLNHEVFYYLLFIPVFVCRNAVTAMFVSFSAGILCVFIPNIHSLITAFGIGFFFWTTGLWVAWNFDTESNDEFYDRFMIPLIFLLIICHVFNPLYFLIPKMAYSQGAFNQALVNIYDLVLWPFCFATILVFSNKGFVFKKIIVLSCFVLPTIYLGILLIKKNHFDTEIGVFAVLFAMSILLTFKTIDLNWTKPFVYIGSISYALYIIHMPLMFLLREIKWIDNVHVQYCIKLALFGMLLFALSYFLEKVLQPKIKHYFFQ